MHGRPRPPKNAVQDPEKLKQQEQKAALFGKLLHEVLARRTAGRKDEETIGLSAKLLELNPEVYTAWNYRREFVEPILAEGGAPALAWVETELQVTLKALQRNPKSYHAWHHRKWVVGKRMCSIDRELELVTMLLDADSRNFHAWTYRRYLAALQGCPPEEELAFSRRRIDLDFSNYSSWHYRTTLLPRLYDPVREDNSHALTVLLSQLSAFAAAVEAAGGAGEGEGTDKDKEEGRPMGAEGVDEATAGSTSAPASESKEVDAAATAATDRGAVEAQVPVPSSVPRPAPLPPLPPPVPSASCIPQEILDAEFELVKQAFFTEPADQSGWFYHRWLVGAVLSSLPPPPAPSTPEASARALSVLEREAAMCHEIMEMEPGCKWAILTRAQLLQAAEELSPSSGRADEVRSLLDSLRTLDPDRLGYYEDCAGGKVSLWPGGRGRAKDTS